MLEWNKLSKDQVSEKLKKYKSDKRLQGFMRHKARNDIMNMKKEVRYLQIGVTPSAESQRYLKVGYSHLRQK